MPRKEQASVGLGSTWGMFVPEGALVRLGTLSSSSSLWSLSRFGVARAPTGLYMFPSRHWSVPGTPIVPGYWQLCPDPSGEAGQYLCGV
mmetsp:Transcript_29887/g.53780  ORF Transcript_29887/g.53780 Transcript_29887/m.53780 type:complete len:89 (-) Transcript_29887:607-873(-)